MTSDLVLVALAVVGSILAFEVMARIWVRWFSRTYVYPPRVIKHFRVMKQLSRELAEEAHACYDSDGFRTKGTRDRATQRILLAGGSTAECLFLGENLTLGSRLAAHLRGSEGPDDVYVATAAKSNMRLVDVAGLLERIGQQQRWDAVVLHCGSSDLLTWLTAGAHDIEEASAPNWDRALARRSDKQFSFSPKNGALAEIARRIGERRRSASGEFVVGRGIIRARESRRHATFTGIPAGFHDVLESVERDATRCFRSALHASRTVIFVPQLYLGEGGRSDDIDGLLWCGALGDAMSSDVRTWISGDALTQALHEINGTCIRIAKSMGVHVVTLAASEICTSRNFYDDFHYTAAGAELVAANIADAIAHDFRISQGGLRQQ